MQAWPLEQNRRPAVILHDYESARVSSTVDTTRHWNLYSA